MIYTVKAFREAVCTGLEGCNQVCLHDMVEVVLRSSPPRFPPASLPLSNKIFPWAAGPVTVSAYVLRKMKRKYCNSISLLLPVAQL